MTHEPEPTNAEVALTLGTLILRIVRGEDDLSLVDEIEAMSPITTHLMLAALLTIVAEQIERGSFVVDPAPREGTG